MARPDDALGPLIEIEDPRDPRLAEYRDLKDPARRTAGETVFVVEGRLAVRQLLASPVVTRSLLVDRRQAASAPDLVAGVRACGSPVYVAEREVLAATVGFALHRGVVAVAGRPAAVDCHTLVGNALARSRRSRAPVLGVLEGVNDHENLGAMFRNAAAFGVAGLLLDPTSADPLYRRSVRVSLGHVLTVPFGRAAPWPGVLEELRATGLLVAALVPDPARTHRTPLHPRELARKWQGRAVALLVGAEGSGLSSAALAAADEIATVPMAPGVDSINVATAAAIAFYEMTTPVGAGRDRADSEEPPPGRLRTVAPR